MSEMDGPRPSGNGYSDIYWIDASFLQQLRPETVRQEPAR